MQRKIWLRVPGFPRVLTIFYKQLHLLALLPSKGYCVLRMLHSVVPTVHRLLPPVGLPCPRSHPPSLEPEPPQVPPPIQPRVVQALAADDSIAIDSCDSDQEIDCDADTVASFEALDEGGTHRCGYLGLGQVFVCSCVCHSRMQYQPKFGPRYRIFLSRSPFWYFFWFNCACYLAFCNGSLHEMSSCSILFYD